MKILLILLTLLAVAYAGLCLLLYLNQDRLLFFPSLAAAAELDLHARQIGFEPWTNARGQRIGWKSAAGDPASALLICHGNGGFALGRNYENLRRDGPAPGQVFLLEYPGYGARPGPISTQAMTAAAIEAIDTLAAERPRRILLFGQSLGSGIACAAAAARPAQLAGLILLTPFDSLRAAAGAHYPWLPVALLLRHRLDSDRNLAKFPGPVAFLVAGRDETIPPARARRLFASYPGPKRLWLVPDAGHNDFDALLADWPQILAWLAAPEIRNPKSEI